MITISTTKTSEDYELLDSGNGEKLERFGAKVLSRPDPQALWAKRLPAAEATALTIIAFTIGAAWALNEQGLIDLANAQMDSSAAARAGAIS